MADKIIEPQAFYAKAGSTPAGGKGASKKGVKGSLFNQHPKLKPILTVLGLTLFFVVAMLGVMIAQRQRVTEGPVAPSAPASKPSADSGANQCDFTHYITQCGNTKNRQTSYGNISSCNLLKVTNIDTNPDRRQYWVEAEVVSQRLDPTSKKHIIEVQLTRSPNVTQAGLTLQRYWCKADNLKACGCQPGENCPTKEDFKAQDELLMVTFTGNEGVAGGTAKKVTIQQPYPQQAVTLLGANSFCGTWQLDVRVDKLLGEGGVDQNCQTCYPNCQKCDKWTFSVINQSCSAPPEPTDVVLTATPTLPVSATPTPVCSCSDWVDQSCGAPGSAENDCAVGSRYRTRTCPNDCAKEDGCFVDPSCSVGGPTATATPTPKQAEIVCPLTAGPNDVLIEFDGLLYVPTPQRLVQSAKIPAGTYKVTLASYDSHSTQPSATVTRQTHEQWYLRIKADGTALKQTAKIADLPDSQDYLTQVVSTNFVLTQDGDQALALHGYPSSTVGDSVYPVCALMELVSVPTNTPTPTVTLPPGTPTPTPTATPVPRCGDGIIQANLNEQCDDGPANSDTEPDACRTTCKLPSCGDSVTDAPEQCDDGNNVNLDACHNDCTTPICGDGIKDVGEECDNGGANSDTVADACRKSCKLPVCGDGIVDIKEACDDGNKVDTDACSNTCVEATCGDGIKNGNDQCDDGNQVDNDACRNNCKLPACGDGVVQTGEACDDGNKVDTDACRNDCTLQPTFACNSSCTNDSECQTVNAEYICDVTAGNKCRLDSNRASESCSPKTYACNSSCETNENCMSASTSYICSTSNGKVCRLASNENASNCLPAVYPTPAPAAGCNELCTSNADCAYTNLICVSTSEGNRCRLDQYTNSTNCAPPPVVNAYVPPAQQIYVPVAQQEYIAQTVDQPVAETKGGQPVLPTELPMTGPADWANWLKAGLVTLGLGAALLLLL